MVIQRSIPGAGLLPPADRLARLTVVCSFVLAACVQELAGQASGHQRLGVESRTPWEAEIEWAVTLGPAGYSGCSLPDLDSSFSFGLFIDRTWSAGLVVPLSLSGVPGRCAPGSVILGDMTVSVGWTGIHGDSRLRGGLNLTAPSGEWFGSQELSGPVAGGTGRWAIGLWGGISRIIDPLVLGGMLSWNFGLPGPEHSGRLWHPGNVSLVLSATEVFNDLVSCTAVLSQYLFLPASIGGGGSWNPSDGTLGYSAVAGIRLLVSGRSFNGGIGFSRSLVHGPDQGSVSFSIARIFRQREEP
jgi:hypothetical protein